MKLCILIVSLSATIYVVESEAKEWWETASFIQIYPRSFKDSDGDGIGDINGVYEKMDYIKELGVSAIWLSPIFESPMADFGYDVSNYTKVHNEYGTNEDLQNLIKKGEELGIRIILDFVPNHTSDEHDWFIRSARNETKYRDYYIWHPGFEDPNNSTNRLLPNNWVSVFRFSAWTYHPIRQEFYLHQFAKQQPDLNFRNPEVVEEMKNVLRYWLDRGVGGFRIDALPYLFEVKPDDFGNYPNEIPSGVCDDPDSTCYLTHNLTQDLEETYDMVYQWRAVLDEYPEQPSKVMLTEAFTTLDNTMKYFGNEIVNGSHIPFNFELLNHMRMESTAADFRKTIKIWMDALPKGRTSNWVMGNHDKKRLSSRFGAERVDLLNILIQTLPGTSVTYNGEEIGMIDVHISWNETLDPQACNTNETVYEEHSRDPARSPFQWDDTTSAGFSTNSSTWLPVSPDYKRINVQLQEKSLKSHLKVFKSLLALRQQDILQNGCFYDYLYLDDIYIYQRQLEDRSLYIVLNFSKKQYLLNLKAMFHDIPKKLEVMVTSIQSKYNHGDIVSSNNINISPNAGTVYYGIYKS